MNSTRKKKSYIYKDPLSIENLINDYKSNVPTTIIMDKYNVNKEIVHKILKNHGIHIKQSRGEGYPSNIKKQVLDDLQNGILPPEIIAKYKVDRMFVYRLAWKYNIKLEGRLYQLRENYFDDINTEKKAYFLGLLWADGHNTGNYNVHINLQEDDDYILQELINELYPNKENRIYYKTINNTILNGKPFVSRVALIDICSKRICERLLNLGMTHLKPERNFIPKINEDYIKYWLRGYFDGDGSISIENNHYQIDISCHPGLDVALKEYIEKSLDIHVGLPKSNLDERNCSRVTVRGNQQVITFLDFIYNKSNIHLKRKYFKYQEIINA